MCQYANILYKEVVIVRKILFILASLGIVFASSSCAFGIDGDSRNTTNITIHDEESSVTFVVQYGKQASVTSFVKQDFYLKGYYDANVGGVKYFDSNGLSLLIWQETNPSEFYAQWGLLSELEFSDGDEGIFTAAYPGYKGFYYEVQNEFFNGVKGNLDKNLSFDVTFKMKAGKNRSEYLFVLKDDKVGPGETFYSQELDFSTSSYISYDLHFNASALVAKNGIIYIYITASLNDTTYYKDITISAVFDV